MIVSNGGFKRLLSWLRLLSYGRARVHRLISRCRFRIFCCFTASSIAHQVQVHARASGCRLQVQPDEHALSIGKIADDFFQRRRKPTDQSRNGYDLISGRQLGIAQQIDNLNSISVAHVRLADLLQIAEGGDRTGSISCDVQPQVPLGRLRRSLDGRLLLPL